MSNPGPASQGSTVPVAANSGQGYVMGKLVDQISFYGATPVSQATPAGNVHTVTAGATTGVFVNTSFDGSVGASAYTIGDLVAILKGLGLIKL